MRLSNPKVSWLAGLLSSIYLHNIRYLENGPSNSNIRPWFWVLCLFLSSVTFTVFWEAYIFFSARALIHTEAILTELVFEHSLRVRFTAEPMNDERSDSQHVRDNSVTMVDESEVDGSSTSGAESDSTATITATATATVQKGKNKMPSPTTVPSEPNAPNGLTSGEALEKY